MNSLPPATRIRRALLSVSDKTGLIEFARCLERHGVELLSTGGTHKLLADAGLPVIEVAEYTGFPEIMGGRVKTLHPRVHGGILARRGQDDGVAREHGIELIDLVVVNLYPFADTVAKPGCTLEEAIEQIDIGGPTMIRAAAKNHRDVTVVVNPGAYAALADELDASGARIEAATRARLAREAFAHTAQYDSAIAAYLAEPEPQSEQTPDASSFPGVLQLRFDKIEDMRYGENPHQRAAFYREPNGQEPSLATATKLQGKALSFNNVADGDAALGCVNAFESPACVIVKHANPCGVATAPDIAEAYESAYATDPTSAFGGIIAFNRPLDGETAQAIVDRQFVEVLIAPQVTPEAARVLADKPNLRVLATGHCNAPSPSWDYKRVAGGLLVQDLDLGSIGPADLRTVTDRAPSEAELADLLFAWTVAKWVKSNAIVYTRGLRTIGIGAGQMSRLYSARIANIKATDEGLEIAGAVMASDAFFPFRDGIDAAAEAGIHAVIQPGGSVRDAEVIQAANEAGMAMVFTGMRHFRH